MIYETLIPQIKTTLESVTLVQEVFAYPETRYNKYPCVVFYPSDFTNAYETTADNAKEYRFKLFVIVGLKQTTKEQVFESTLPKVIDQILSAFDEQWDYGTVDGHRVRTLLGTGLWDTQETEQGEIAFAQLDLIIKTLTTN